LVLGASEKGTIVMAQVSASEKKIMIANDVKSCDYCHASIVADQRWVREKIYAPRSNRHDPTYLYFHAEPFGGEEGSCWEKHEMDREIARTAVSQASTGRLQAMR
jgi:hypothetical protein